MATDTETETAVGYIRLSQDGKSLARQRRNVEDYATEHGAELVTIYDEGKRSSGFDTDRPEYTALREHVADGGVDTVIVPNLSRLSRDRKERLRLLLDVDTAGVAVHSVELGRAVDLDDDWALVHQSIQTHRLRTNSGDGAATPSPWRIETSKTYFRTSIAAKST